MEPVGGIDGVAAVGIAAVALDSAVVVSPDSSAVVDGPVGYTFVRVAVHSVYEGRKYHLVPVADW